MSIHLPELRCLLIVPGTACSPTTGGGQRTLLLYQVLQRLARVDVLVIADAHERPYRDAFPDAPRLEVVRGSARSELGFWRWLRPLRPETIEAVARAVGDRRALYRPDPQVAPIAQRLLASPYDVIVGRYLQPTAQAGVLDQTAIPVVIDLDDRDDAVLQARLQQPGLPTIGRWLLQRQLQQLNTVLPRLLAASRHLWVASLADAQAIGPAASVLPNIPYAAHQTAAPPNLGRSSTQTVLFVGGYWHRVNREGVLRFATQCWPAIVAAVPQAQFRIVGSGNWELAQALLSHLPNLEVVGYRDDLVQEYAQAAFTVVPLFEGGGTKIKVLESLYYQRTAVITEHAHYGYERLRDRASLLVARTEGELIDRCIELLNQPQLAAALAAQGHTQVMANYSFASFATAVEETFATLCLPASSQRSNSPPSVLEGLGGCRQPPHLPEHSPEGA